MSNSGTSNSPLLPDEALSIADSVQNVTGDASAAAAFKQFSVGAVSTGTTESPVEPMRKVMKSEPLGI